MDRMPFVALQTLQVLEAGYHEHARAQDLLSGAVTKVIANPLTLLIAYDRSPSHMTSGEYYRHVCCHSASSTKVEAGESKHLN